MYYTQRQRNDNNILIERRRINKQFLAIFIKESDPVKTENKKLETYI